MSKEEYTSLLAQRILESILTELEDDCDFDEIDLQFYQEGTGD